MDTWEGWGVGRVAGAGAARQGACCIVPPPRGEGGAARRASAGTGKESDMPRQICPNAPTSPPPPRRNASTRSCTRTAQSPHPTAGYLGFAALFFTHTGEEGRDVKRGRDRERDGSLCSSVSSQVPPCCGALLSLVAATRAVPAVGAPAAASAPAATATPVIIPVAAVVAVTAAILLPGAAHYVVRAVLATAVIEDHFKLHFCALWKVIAVGDGGNVAEDVLAARLSALVRPDETEPVL